MDKTDRKLDHDDEKPLPTSWSGQGICLRWNEHLWRSVTEWSAKAEGWHRFFDHVSVVGIGCRERDAAM